MPADGPVAAAVLRACAALEFVQACALIHDDIIDASRTRRGHPTTHREFARLHGQRGWSGLAGQVRRGGRRSCSAIWRWPGPTTCSSARGWSRSGTGAAAPAWAAMRTEVLGGQLLDIVSEASRDE